MNKIFQLLLNVTFSTRLISITILIISVLVSSLTFFVLIRLHYNLINLDAHFYKNFANILSYDTLSLIEKNNQKDLKHFVETIYVNTSNIKYIHFFNIIGDENNFFSFPIDNFLSKDIYNWFNEISYFKFSQSFCSTNNNYFEESKYSVIEIFCPLVKNNTNLGLLKLGLISNINIIHSLNMAKHLTVLSFVSIWFMFTLGIIFNFSMVTESIFQLILGLKNIVLGNFCYKINFYSVGELGYLIFLFNKMSERLQYYEKQNVAHLISEKAKLQALVSIIEDGAILLDTELRLLFINKVAIKVFQWFNKDLIGKVISQYLPIHVNEALLPILNRLIKSGYLYNQAVHVEEVIIDLNYESLKTFRFSLSTLLTHNSTNFNGVIITIQDITRETQLNKAKNQFISNVSHELRTPLCNIGSFLETLIDYNHKLTVQQKNQFLLIAYSETQRLNTLVDDVLDLSKLHSDYSYILKPVLLINTVSYIIQASQIIASNKKVKILLEIHSTVKKVLAHEISLHQVLSNLVSNSLKFTHRDGYVIIRIYPLPSSYKFSDLSINSQRIVRLEVIDEGIGIGKVFQSQIFDRFMRIENNIHTLKGTGLGLSIVKNIIEKHNSTILFFSEVGIGTSFYFDLFVAY